MAAPKPAPQINVRVEQQLLLCASRTRTDDQQIQRLRQLVSSEVDWDCLLALARKHAVEQLVHKQLSEHAAEIVPPEFLQKLRRLSQANFARNHIFTSELYRLIKMLAASGIEAIPFKGPALAVFAYGDLNLRRYVDLDIMVQREDVLAARKLLLADGYDSGKSLTLSQQQVLLQTQHNLQFRRDQGRMIVELHWEVASHLFASSVQAKDLWSNLVEVELNGTTVKSLSADDLLFSLCIHGSRHLWERLGWVCDISELISRHQINWEALLVRASRTDTSRMFLLGLILAEQLLGTPLPSTVKDKIEDDQGVKALAEAVTDQLFEESSPRPASVSEIFKYNIAVRSSWKARARYILYMLRPTEGDLNRRLPDRLRFIYYFERPFRLLFKSF